MCPPNPNPPKGKWATAKKGPTDFCAGGVAKKQNENKRWGPPPPKKNYPLKPRMESLLFWGGLGVF